MRFDVSSTALLSHLQSIGKVIASKNTLPILDNFLFQVVMFLLPYKPLMCNLPALESFLLLQVLQLTS